MKLQPAANITVFLAVLLSAASASAQSAREVRAPENSHFVASSRGHVYYPLSCEAWRGLSSENLLFFSSASEAEAEGYSPTTDRACQPPAALQQGEVGGRRGPICVVSQILDGDTLDCRDGPRIRLLLIDAPETEQAQFGLRAKLALEELIPLGTATAVGTDVQGRDRYGRTLAHLYRSDGTWVNRAMVRRGYAVTLVVPPNVRGVEAIRAAADSARVEERGLWATGGFECLPVDARAGRCDLDGWDF